MVGRWWTFEGSVGCGERNVSLRCSVTLESLTTLAVEGVWFTTLAVEGVWFATLAVEGVWFATLAVEGVWFATLAVEGVGVWRGTMRTCLHHLYITLE